MKYQIRLLQKQDELKRLTDLEREVWGFPEDDSDSLLTMKVMPNQEFKIGYTFGTFFDDPFDNYMINAGYSLAEEYDLSNLTDEQLIQFYQQYSLDHGAPPNPLAPGG